MKDRLCGSAVNEIEYYESTAKERQDAIDALAYCKKLEESKPKRKIRTDKHTIETDGFRTLMMKVTKRKRGL